MDAVASGVAVSGDRSRRRRRREGRQRDAVGGRVGTNPGVTRRPVAPRDRAYAPRHGMTTIRTRPCRQAGTRASTSRRSGMSANECGRAERRASDARSRASWNDGSSKTPSPNSSRHEGPVTSASRAARSSGGRSCRMSLSMAGEPVGRPACATTRAQRAGQADCHRARSVSPSVRAAGAGVSISGGGTSPATSSAKASRTQSISIASCGSSSMARIMSCGQGSPGIGWVDCITPGSRGRSRNGTPYRGIPTEHPWLPLVHLDRWEPSS